MVVVPLREVGNGLKKSFRDLFKHDEIWRNPGLVFGESIAGAIDRLGAVPTRKNPYPFGISYSRTSVTSARRHVNRRCAILSNETQLGMLPGQEGFARARETTENCLGADRA
jgi:hypothetical protein